MLHNKMKLLSFLGSDPSKVSGCFTWVLNGFRGAFLRQSSFIISMIACARLGVGGWVFGLLGGVLHFCNHVNLIAVSEHHHHHNSNSKTLQLSIIIIIIPLWLLRHFTESIPELLQGHDYSEFIIITLHSLSYSEFITGISYVNGIQ